MGGHPVPYDFAPFLDAVAEAAHTDPLLDAWLEGPGSGKGVDAAAHQWLQGIAQRTATTLRDTADFVEQPENRPRLTGKGPYDNDPQAVVLPAETWEALAWIHTSGLWDPNLPERARYAAVYLLNQHGEAGITCSVACTDGLWRVLRAHGHDPHSQAVVLTLEGQGDGRRAPRDSSADAEGASAEWIHGAQFVTEIQGGSDAAANAMVARQERPADRHTDRGDGPSPTSPPGAAPGGAWSLWGQKWFCSNLTADYWLVTARPENNPGGGKGVALFCVPRDQDGYTIERLKDKLGTRALPTAEIRFHGARGWPVGPLDQGLRTMVREVLVPSRIHNIIAAASFARTAAREARAYADWRTAFGTPLARMPLVADAVARVEASTDLMEAGAFATVDAWLEARNGAGSGSDVTAAAETTATAAGATRTAPAAPSPDAALWARVHISIAKAVTTRRLPGLIHEALSVLGGNGIEERFTVLPRLLRDAVILETWEGPYTLLLMQALGDLHRGGVAGREAEFLAAGLGEGPGTEALAAELAGVLTEADETAQALAWRELAHRIQDAWEQKALQALRKQ